MNEENDPCPDSLPEAVWRGRFCDEEAAETL